jgi:hypothetical protein
MEIINEILKKREKEGNAGRFQKKAKKLDAEFKPWTRLAWKGDLSMEKFSRLHILENMYKHYNPRILNNTRP